MSGGETDAGQAGGGQTEDGCPRWPDHTPRNRYSFSVAAFCQKTSVDLEGSRIMGGRRLSLSACLDSRTGDRWTPRREKPPELTAWPDSCSSSTLGRGHLCGLGKVGSRSSPLAGRDSLGREGAEVQGLHCTFHGCRVPSGACGANLPRRDTHLYGLGGPGWVGPPVICWDSTVGWWCSVAQSCLTLGDPMDCSTLGLPVLHYFPGFAHTHVH